MRVAWFKTLLGSAVLIGTFTADAQIDPYRRNLVQIGYNQPLEGRGPVAAYAFYYSNTPDFPSTNQTLRLAIAPVYMDGELGLKGLLGENTDLGIGLAGGGFADSYNEVRSGRLWREESYDGHGAGTSVSLYHLFNPGAQIPLNGVAEASVHYSFYSRGNGTDPAFVLPEDHLTGSIRTGFRWGGAEPLLSPRVGMEISAWYEGQFRTRSGGYGYSGDRDLNLDSHLFWSRASLTYTLPESRHRFSAAITAGTSLHSDRSSAYRLGAFLPLVSEFPLSIPGYYFQELSARQFALLSGTYDFPLDSRDIWRFMVIGSVGGVDNLESTDRSGNLHSGVGGAISYNSPASRFRIIASYAYGFNAIRNGERGANNIAILCEIDLDQVRQTTEFTFDPRSPFRSRGFFKLFGQ
jgi:hypothetical protein